MELMVALIVGIIITLGVVQIFSANRATYQLDEALARAQENARFAMEFLTVDIRQAGYLGCNRDTSMDLINYLASPSAVKLSIQGVEAYEFVGTGIGDAITTASNPANTYTGWSPAITATMVPSGALPGTDVIKIARMVPKLNLVAPYITSTSVFIDPAFSQLITIKDVLLVADCKAAATFMVTDYNSSTGEIGHTASATTNRCGAWRGIDTANAAAAQCPGTFDVPAPGTLLGTMETIVFYVANDVVSGQPTLFKNVLGPGNVSAGAPQALVEGVENFQVLYGVDDNGIPDGIADRYATADNVGDFSKVVSVQIGILVYGVNSTGKANDTETDAEAKIVAGTSITAPSDKRKRRVFNTTIQLRNRGT